MLKKKIVSKNRLANRSALLGAMAIGWLAFLFPGLFTGVLAQTVAPRCQTDLYQFQLHQRTPQVKLSQERLQKLLSIDRSMSGRARIEGTDEETYIIPVVVHVIHNNRSGYVGGANNTNISDEQIFSQIEVLNEDYRRKPGTNGFNTSPVGADVNIEFRLASVDPSGNPSNGIVRVYNEKESFAMHEDVQLKSLSSWPSNRYLNIWVTSLSNNFLGYAQFPDAGSIPGLTDNEGAAETDGVVINHRNFGRVGTAASGVYNLGRSTTHEVGHWLGLIHTWGDETCGDDYCDDTPPTEGPNNTTSCPELFSNCGGGITQNMIENYMDYSPDRCMNLFTQCQKDRIRSVLRISPRRWQLIEAARELPESNVLSVQMRSRNPVRNGYVSFDVLFRDLQDLRVEVFDAIGKSVMAADYPNSGSRNVRLDVHSLRRGVYLVHVSTPRETQVKRLLVLNDE
jgi:hypothetical protein